MVVIFDVIIIGAGVVGCAIAREVSRYDLSVMVIEKNSDVATGVSKANSGIVHEGYDAAADSLKAKYNVLGQKMFEELSEELDFPFERCGSLVLCFDKEDVGELEKLLDRGKYNGLDDLRIAYKDELKELEPNINENVYAALVAPSGGIVSPYEMTVAYADNACMNGVKFNFDCEVLNCSKENDVFKIETEKGEYLSKILVNAAGLNSDCINNMLSSVKHEIIPRRGEYCLLDRENINFVNHTLFQLPTKMGKGILVTRTPSGNTILGPTSEDIEDKQDTKTTKKGLDVVLEKAELSVKELPRRNIITSFTGLRAHCVTAHDFTIGESEDVKGLLNLVGIESPGLTSAPAIAKEIEKLVCEILKPNKKENFNPKRKGITKFRYLSSEERKKLIEEDKDYGTIVCRCETVTKAEVLQALRSPVPARDLDGVKRRTRTGMGRCQGGFCSMRMLDIISEELNIEMTEVTKCGGNSNILIEKNKTEL